MSQDEAGSTFNIQQLQEGFLRGTSDVRTHLGTRKRNRKKKVDQGCLFFSSSGNDLSGKSTSEGVRKGASFTLHCTSILLQRSLQQMLQVGLFVDTTTTCRCSTSCTRFQKRLRSFDNTAVLPDPLVMSRPTSPSRAQRLRTYFVLLHQNVDIL